MKHLAFAASLLLLASAWACGQSTGSCANPVTLPGHDGISLNIQSLSSEIDVTGTDEDGIRISCTVSDGNNPERIHIRAEQTGDFGKIQVSGSRTNNLHIRIEVPRKTSFRLHMPAGQVNVNGVSGDKEIEVGAGQVVVSNVDAAQYHSVHASVDVGDVRAAAFGADKGGFFRSFDKDTAGGRYRLHVHVMTGSVELN